MEIEANIAAIATWWQKRQILNSINDPSMKDMDKIFVELKGQMDAKDYESMIAELEANAEEIRRKAIKAVWETIGNDQQIKEIIKSLNLDLGFD